MAEKAIATRSNSNSTKNSNIMVCDTNLETNKAEKHVWLMKCPSLVARSFQERNSPLSSGNNPHYSSSSSRPAAKVIVSVDPLVSNDNFSSTQVLYFIIFSILHVVFFSLLPHALWNLAMYTTFLVLWKAGSLLNFGVWIRPKTTQNSPHYGLNFVVTLHN